MSGKPHRIESAARHEANCAYLPADMTFIKNKTKNAPWPNISLIATSAATIATIATMAIKVAKHKNKEGKMESN